MQNLEKALIEFAILALAITLWILIEIILLVAGPKQPKGKFHR